ncbi:MAG: glycosyltransferase family 2 protein [Candidatus Pacebacteria bacterium]|nr:glycosyltransferase family 2 protein [Candidatus Paceibacterota bacterium]
MENNTKNVHLSVVIPAYNEEKRVGDTIMDISKYLIRQDYSWEIVVVNDGSKDGTARAVSELLPTIHNLRLIDNKKNQGKGGVVKQGMLEAEGDYRLFVDADNAIKIDHIEKFWPYAKDYDVVIGSIEIEGAKKVESYTGFSNVYRNIFGKLSKYLVRAVAIWEIHDTQRAFKLFSAKAAETIFPKQTITRWGFDMEVLIIAKKQGFKIKELPVAWLNPPGKVNFASYLKTLLELFQIKINAITGKYSK